MKLMPHLKKGINVCLKDAKTLVFSFIVLPIVLSLVYGNMQRDLFDGKNHSIEAVKVHFQYDEVSGKGAVFKQILEQDRIKEFISIQNQDYDYTIVIDENFKNVEIRGKDEGTTQFLLLKNFMRAIVSNFNQYEVVQNTVDELKLNEEDKGRLLQSLSAALEDSGDKPLVKERIVEGYKTLNSIEYYSISIFSFTSLIMIVTLAGYFYKEVKEGIVKRTLSTPNDKRDYFIGFLLNAFFTSAAISLSYVFINRVRGAAFKDNPIHLLIIILVQSILAASVVGLVIAFIKKEMTANVLMNLMLVIPSIFGGAFFYSELVGSKILRTIFNSMPNSLILSTYKDLAITGSLQAVQGQLLLMGAVSAVALFIAIVKIERKWEV
jgi:ABC-2 type transport system permease protein